MKTILSPLRYPGGKTKYWHLFKNIFKGNNLKIDTFIEPFCGGAGLGLTLLKKKIIKNLILNEKDDLIYNFWKTLLDEPLELQSIIERESITYERFIHWKNIYKNERFSQSLSNVERAYAFFFINRATRSGIYNAGPIGGKKQNGDYLIDARFNKRLLIEKIIYISSLKNQISIYNDDFDDLIEKIITNDKNINIKESLIYFDPPYHTIGKKLYNKYFVDKDHLRLQELLKRTKNLEWILSYNKNDHIVELYKTFNIYNARFRNTANTRVFKDEILILSDNIELSNGMYGAIDINKIVK